MDDYWNPGRDDYSDIQDRALGARYVRYKWCANEPCMCALGSLIFLLEYSSVYSHNVSCFITDARVCWRSLWGSVVFIWAPDTPNSLYLQRNYWWRRLSGWRVSKRRRRGMGGGEVNVCNRGGSKRVSLQRSSQGSYPARPWPRKR